MLASGNNLKLTSDFLRTQRSKILPLASYRQRNWTINYHGPPAIRSILIFIYLWYIDARLQSWERGLRCSGRLRWRHSPKDSPVLFSSKSHSSLRRSVGVHGTSANIVRDLRVTCECPSRVANTYVTLACTARYRYKSLTCSALYTQVVHGTREAAASQKSQPAHHTYMHCKDHALANKCVLPCLRLPSIACGWLSRTAGCKRAFISYDNN